MGFDVQTLTRPNPVPVRGSADMWEFAGSVRYNFLSDWILPFARLGYGWSWYRLANVNVDGVPLSTPTSDWFKQPSIFPPKNLWPNEWLVGLGVEVLAFRSRHDLFHGADLGAKLDLTYTAQPVEVPFVSPIGLGLQAPSPTTHRFGLSLSGVLSF
jgi:hypothetical protein